MFTHFFTLTGIFTPMYMLSMFLLSTRYPMWWNPLAETNVFATYLFSPQSNCADFIVASKFTKFCIGVINIWLREVRNIFTTMSSQAIPVDMELKKVIVSLIITFMTFVYRHIFNVSSTEKYDLGDINVFMQNSEKDQTKFSLLINVNSLHP